MRRFPRVLTAVLAVLMVTSPMASAAPLMYPKVLDEQIGNVSTRLDRANSTYGERDEFQRSKASLARASLSLLSNASVIAQSKLVNAEGGLETGRARAQAGGSGQSQQVVDHGRQLAAEAESKLRQVRGNLESMEKAGLDPIGFSGGLTVAYTANRAMDLLRKHHQALDQYEKGESNEQLEAAIVSGGAGARMLANVAAETLSRVAKAHANSTSTHLLSYEELKNVTADRVDWTKKNNAPLAKQSRDRVLSLDEDGGRLMTLGAFGIFFQDLAFNGMRKQVKTEGNIDPMEEAWDLHNRSRPLVEDWVQTLGVNGELPLGAMRSGELVLEQNVNATGKHRDTTGAFGIGLIHLGVEYTGMMQQAYGNEEHDPGTDLKPASIGDQDDSGVLPVPAPGAFLALAAVALAALRSRRETA